MKSNKNYIYIALFIFLVIIGLYFKYQKSDTTLPIENPSGELPNDKASVTITTKEIKETNFTGKVSVVSGDNVLARKAQSYIDEAVKTFKEQADKDVPDIRREFGVDTPSAQYEIIVQAEYIASEKTESVAMLTYEYTGGAHGNNSYNVITASKTSGEILALNSMIKTDKQKSFTDLVKKELYAWRPFDSTDTVVFTEEVDALNFDSFKNWSLDNENLILYFSQYDIGPGVLGPVAYPIPLEKVTDMLK